MRIAVENREMRRSIGRFLLVCCGQPKQLPPNRYVPSVALMRMGSCPSSPGAITTGIAFPTNYTPMDLC
jgi:hypothetical protein